MNWMGLEHIAGTGKKALYNLYIDARRVGEALTMDEVKALITNELEENDDGISVDPAAPDLRGAGNAGLPAEPGAGRSE